MKKYKLYLASLLLVASATGCKDDYMNINPESTVAESVLFETPETAQYAVNGLSRMWYSIKYHDDQALFGLPCVFFWNNDFTGDALQEMDYTGFKNTSLGTYFTSPNNKNMRFPWYLFYKVISNANTILSKVPETAASTDDQKKWDYIKAQTLVFRAYCYQMLTNYYCRRWTDRNGESRGVVLRLEPSDDPMLPCSLAQVYEQIYKDLDEALALFASAGIKRPSSSRWMADESVAHAIYSRAALFRQDWQTSINHAKEARKNYPLMNDDEYKVGFNVANKEWIWECYEDATQSSNFYSFFGYVSPATTTSFNRSRVPIISKELVNAIDPNDSRLEIYCIPTETELTPAAAKKLTTSGKVTSGDFYKRIKNTYVPAGRVHSAVPIAYYMGTKFISSGGTADGEFVIFRSAEMYYNEIEALLKLGKEGDAKALLEEVIAPYNSSYTCTKSGDALWQEYVNYRKFDLWGEGHNWPDLKRWGVALVRHKWSEGGNWNVGFACNEEDYGPNDKNHWTVDLPEIETLYNNLINTKESDNWVLGQP